MKSVLRLARSVGVFALDGRVLYLLAGLITSVVAHELVHVIMHFGSINSVHFLPNIGTVVAMNVDYIEGYSVDVEEAIAYTVTIIVQFITIIDVFAIHDSRDRKTTEQLVFGKNNDLTAQESNRLLQAVLK